MPSLTKKEKPLCANSQGQAEAQAIANEFKAVFEKETLTIIAQNAKYDIQVMMNYIEIKARFDTMLAHYLIDPDTRHNMNVLAENYLNYTPVSITDLIGKKRLSKVI